MLFRKQHHPQAGDGEAGGIPRYITCHRSKQSDCKSKNDEVINKLQTVLSISNFT